MRETCKLELDIATTIFVMSFSNTMVWLFNNVFCFTERQNNTLHLGREVQNLSLQTLDLFQLRGSLGAIEGRLGDFMYDVGSFICAE